MSTRLASRSVLLILASIIGAWVLVLVATYTDLFVTPIVEDGVYLGESPAVRASIYLLVGAVALVAVVALISQRLAVKARLADGPESRLPRAAHRFSTLTIIITLAFATILGMTVFVSSFPGGREQVGIGVRFLTTYVPILLYAAIIVTVLLVGFVFRRDSLPKSVASDDAPSIPAQGSEQTPPNTRYLGGAYALPIIAGAIALIFGLVVYDLTQTRLEWWIWVIIHLIIAAGIIAGTVLAEKAIREEAGAESSRTRITRSSRILNFVLSVVFIAVVTVMGFSTGTSAIEGLRSSPQLSVDIYPGKSENLEDFEVSVGGWDLKPGTTVTATLEPTGDVLVTGEVSQFRDFNKQSSLPDALPTGDYTITAMATGINDVALERSMRFSVDDARKVTVSFPPGWEWNESESTILTPSWTWGLREILPAFVMLLIGLGTTFITITRRSNPRVKTS